MKTRQAGACDASLSGLRLDRPSPARVHDYLLGGSINFEIDRAAAGRLTARVPYAGEAARENRQFLGRAVRFMADRGILQYLDLGTGLPAQGSVAELARGRSRGARVVGVDNDPLVLAHGRALLGTVPGATIIDADIREPAVVLADPRLRALLDFSAPVAILLVAVLHFIGAQDEPAKIVRTFRDVMAPGSFLVISHLTSDGPPAEHVRAAEQLYAAAGAPLAFRTREQIAGLFDGFEVEEPGIVRPWQWRPVQADGARTNGHYAGVARVAE